MKNLVIGIIGKTKLLVWKSEKMEKNTDPNEFWKDRKVLESCFIKISIEAYIKLAEGTW